MRWPLSRASTGSYLCPFRSNGPWRPWMRPSSGQQTKGLLSLTCILWLHPKECQKSNGKKRFKSVLTLNLALSLLKKATNWLWMYVWMSCVDGRSALMAFGRIATRQFRNVALFATARLWSIDKYDNGTANTLQLHALGCRTPRIPLPLSVHHLLKTLLVWTETSHQGSSVLPSRASTRLVELRSGVLRYSSLHTVPYTARSGYGCAGGMKNYCLHGRPGAFHSFQETSGHFCSIVSDLLISCW